MAKAASAAFFFGMIACSGPLQAQQANENERDMIGAAERGEIVVVKKLLAGGARIDARDQRGRTALLAATQRNRTEIARFLIQEGADVNAKDFIQDSPYLYAAAEGRIEILKMALAAGADLKDTNRYRGTGLIPAAHHGHVEAVKLLLGTAIDKDHVNKLGWTALLEAVILGDGGPVHTEIVRLLVEADANVNIADREGVTPLTHATRRGYAAMVRILEARGRVSWRIPYGAIAPSPHGPFLPPAWRPLPNHRQQRETRPARGLRPWRVPARRSGRPAPRPRSRG